ncbi:14151_t:CDS:2 [Dentiscutata erythropus]|uniref:14151_t:CDS:1 n=1 Tax=Dentiscutata erythropus TaxID=1348616 RepID=A0A9N9A6Q7_9GLOM|nr:14151_t:CDS:2 [Dentiscutata erythropus]
MATPKQRKLELPQTCNQNRNHANNDESPKSPHSNNNTTIVAPLTSLSGNKPIK